MAGEGDSQRHFMAGHPKTTIGTSSVRISCLGLLLFSFIASGVGANSGQGTLEIRLKDHREAIGDFSRLNLTIDQIALSPKAGLMFWQVAWNHLMPSVKSVDLTQYIGDKSIRVFRGSVDSGSFDAVHLKLKGVEGILKKDRRIAKVKNLVGPIKLTFEILPQRDTVIILDLVVLDMSDHPPRAYELGIKGYALYTNGKLVDKIPPG